VLAADDGEGERDFDGVSEMLGSRLGDVTESCSAAESCRRESASSTASRQARDWRTHREGTDDALSNNRATVTAQLIRSGRENGQAGKLRGETRQQQRCRPDLQSR